MTFCLTILTFDLKFSFFLSHDFISCSFLSLYKGLILTLLDRNWFLDLGQSSVLIQFLQTELKSRPQIQDSASYSSSWSFAWLSFFILTPPSFRIHSLLRPVSSFLLPAVILSFLSPVCLYLSNLSLSLSLTPQVRSVSVTPPEFWTLRFWSVRHQSRFIQRWKNQRRFFLQTLTIKDHFHWFKKLKWRNSFVEIFFTHIESKCKMKIKTLRYYR